MDGLPGDMLTEVAPLPGLAQSFPVVAPLSSRRLGPQDVCKPAEAFAKIQADERQGDEWTFRRDRAKAALARGRQVATGRRHRAEEAQKAERVAEVAAAKQKEEAEKVAAERRKQGDDLVRALRARVEEAKRQREEVEALSRQRIQEARQLLDNEKAHTAQVEAMLKQERRRSEAARRGVEKELAQSDARLASRDGDIAEAEKQASQRIEASEQVGKSRLRSVEERCRAELQTMHERLQKAQFPARNACNLRLSERLELKTQQRNLEF